MEYTLGAKVASHPNGLLSTHYLCSGQSNPRIEQLESYSVTGLKTRTKCMFVMQQTQDLCMPYICVMMLLHSRSR